MARWMEPADEAVASYATWVAERPDVVRKIAERFDPWTLYRLKPGRQRVTIYSFSENGTVTVDITGEFNLIDFERRVFGIDPENLVECDLPSEGEPLGVVLSEALQLALINKRRAENGLPPMAALTQEEADKR